jgi:uncharacterized membrane protein YecN with MAPEG domain
MPNTALYAAQLALLFIFLSVRVIAARRAAKVAVGDGGDKFLLRRMRVHANFAEYVPFALVLMALAESQRAPALLLHALGAALVLGRCVHAYGVSQPQETISLRVFGMSMTLAVIAVAALTNLGLALVRP